MIIFFIILTWESSPWWFLDDPGCCL